MSSNSLKKSYEQTIHLKSYIQGVSKLMQPIDMIMIYWNKRNGSHFWTRPVENASFELVTSNHCSFNCYYISFQDMQSFLFFLSQ